MTRTAHAMRTRGSTSAPQGVIARHSSSSCCGTRGGCAHSFAALRERTPTIWRRRPLSARGIAQAIFVERGAMQRGSPGSAGACSLTAAAPRSGAETLRQATRRQSRSIRARRWMRRSTPTGCLPGCRRASAPRSPCVSAMAGRTRKLPGSWACRSERSNHLYCADGKKRRE